MLTFTEDNGRIDVSVLTDAEGPVWVGYFAKEVGDRYAFTSVGFVFYDELLEIVEKLKQLNTKEQA